MTAETRVVLPARAALAVAVAAMFLIAGAARGADIQGKPVPLTAKPRTPTLVQSGSGGESKVSPYAKLNRQSAKAAETSGATATQGAGARVARRTMKPTAMNHH
jgi:hypothetical protein